QTTAASAYPANTDAQTAYDTLQELDRLIEQNARLEKQNQELMEQVRALRRRLAQQASTATPARQEASLSTEPVESAISSPPAQETPAAPAAAVTEKKEKWGTYTPNLGFKVADTPYGDLSISIYTYARYLNQRALKDTFTDSFGNVKGVQQRQDFQLQKLQMKFLGWVFDPKLRYFLYAWSSNANQGQPAQVVLAGNLNFDFNKHVSLGAGVFSLPNTRSV